MKLHRRDVHGIGELPSGRRSEASSWGGKTRTNNGQSNTLPRRRFAPPILSAGVVWHFCDVPGCSFKTKAEWTLKRHKRQGCVHASLPVTLTNFTVKDVKIKWYRCLENGCEYKAKHAAQLKNRVRFQHKEDVWYLCECGYRTIQGRSLETHKAKVHGIESFLGEEIERIEGFI